VREIRRQHRFTWTRCRGDWRTSTDYNPCTSRKQSLKWTSFLCMVSEVQLKEPGPTKSEGFGRYGCNTSQNYRTPESWCSGTMPIGKKPGSQGASSVWRKSPLSSYSNFSTIVRNIGYEFFRIYNDKFLVATAFHGSQFGGPGGQGGSSSLVDTRLTDR
jgi:hypothetical protein